MYNLAFKWEFSSKRCRTAGAGRRRRGEWWRERRRCGERWRRLAQPRFPLLFLSAQTVVLDACIWAGTLCFFPCSNAWCPGGVLDYFYSSIALTSGLWQSARLHVVIQFWFSPWVVSLKCVLLAASSRSGWGSTRRETTRGCRCYSCNFCPSLSSLSLGIPLDNQGVAFWLIYSYIVSNQHDIFIATFVVMHRRILLPWSLIYLQHTAYTMAALIHWRIVLPWDPSLFFHSIFYPSWLISFV
jgi:hypothetical protein